MAGAYGSTVVMSRALVVLYCPEQQLGTALAALALLDEAVSALADWGFPTLIVLTVAHAPSTAAWAFAGSPSPPVPAAAALSSATRPVRMLEAERSEVSKAEAGVKPSPCDEAGREPPVAGRDVEAGSEVALARRTARM